MGVETEQARPAKRVRRILCAADPRGSVEAIDALLRAASSDDVQAIAALGDLGGAGGDRAEDYPSLHGVHGTAAFAPGTVLVAGFGGEVDDDPECISSP